MFDLHPMACELTLEDPQGTAPIQRAYAVLVETQLNFEVQALIGVFKVWRSREAYIQNKQPVTVIPVTIKPEEGGKDFFLKRGLDGAEGVLGPHVRNLCVSHSPELCGAIMAENIVLTRAV